MEISIIFNCLYSKYDRFTVMLTGCGKQGVGSTMTNLRSGFQVGAVFKHFVVLLGVGSFLQDVTVHISFVFNRLRSNYDRFTVTLTGCEKLGGWVNYDKFTVGLSGRDCLQTSCRFTEGRHPFARYHC